MTNKLYRRIATILPVCFLLLTISAGCDKTPDGTTSTLTTLGSDASESTASSMPEFVAQPGRMEDIYEAQLIPLLNKTFMIDGTTITAEEYNYHLIYSFQLMSTYAQYGYYPATATQSLDLSATCDMTPDGKGTWGEFMVSQVIDEIRQFYILCSLAKDNDISISEETSKQIEEDVAQISAYAESTGMSTEAYIRQLWGENMTVDQLKNLLKRLYLADMYSGDYIENYQFAEGELALPTVRHILYSAPINGIQEADATEEEIEAARVKAEETLERIAAYEDMVLIGDEHLRNGIALESAEYTVSKGQMVPEFEQWCFDPEREIGDKDIVRTDYGFHVIFFVGTKDADDAQKKAISQGALLEMVEELAKQDRFKMTEISQ